MACLLTILLYGIENFTEESLDIVKCHMILIIYVVVTNLLYTYCTCTILDIRNQNQSLMTQTMKHQFIHELTLPEVIAQTCSLLIVRWTMNPYTLLQVIKEVQQFMHGYF